MQRLRKHAHLPHPIHFGRINRRNRFRLPTSPHAQTRNPRNHYHNSHYRNHRPTNSSSIPLQFPTPSTAHSLSTHATPVYKSAKPASNALESKPR